MRACTTWQVQEGTSPTDTSFIPQRPTDAYYDFRCRYLSCPTCFQNAALFPQ